MYIAELLGAFEGLKLAGACGFNRVEWPLLSSSKVGTRTCWNLLQHMVQIYHSYIKTNVCVDALTTIACDGGVI